MMPSRFFPPAPALSAHRRGDLGPSRLTVRALAYRRTRTPSFPGIDLAANTRELAALAVEEALQGNAPIRSIDEHVISSTVISPLLMDGGSLGDAFVSGVSAGLGRHLDWMTCPYECAGWGFVLRDQCLRSDLTHRSRRLLLQVIDVDIHRFGVWRSNPKWGASGFGIGTVMLDIAPNDAVGGAPPLSAGECDPVPARTPELDTSPPGAPSTRLPTLPPVRALRPPTLPIPARAAATPPVVVGAAAPAFILPQWARALREFCRSRPGLPVALPFFPEDQRQALVRTVEGEIAPDGHPRFGHCFGSDPWISWLLWLADPSRPAPDRIVVSSLALNGYHATADVQLDRAATCHLRDDA